RDRNAVERQAFRQETHVLDRRDSDPGSSDLAAGERIVGVVTHLGRQVERHRKTGLALLEKVSVSPVGLARRAVSGVLAHRPEAGPKHLRVDPPGVRKFAGRGLSVERTDGNAGVGFGGRRRVPRPLLASRIDRRARPFPLHASIVAYPPRTESPVAPLYNLVRDSAFPGATLHVRLPRPAPVDGDESAVRTGHVETRKRPEGRHRL